MESDRPNELKHVIEALVRAALETLVPVIERAIDDRVQVHLRALGASATTPIRERRRVDPFVGTYGPVARGTRGRELIRVIAQLGGGASVPMLARSLRVAEGVSPEVHVQRVRSQLRHLARHEHRYVESARRGVWRLTMRGAEVARRAEIEMLATDSVWRSDRRETNDQPR